jgi:hypothetical protein
LICCSFICVKTSDFVFYIHGSVHRDSILIRSNEMQQYAGIYLLQNYSTCFGCLSHPSSGVHKTVTAASGTGYSVRATTFCQRGLKATLAEGCCSDTSYDLYQKLQLQLDVLLMMGATDARNM